MIVSRLVAVYLLGAIFVSGCDRQDNQMVSSEVVQPAAKASLANEPKSTSMQEATAVQQQEQTTSGVQTASNKAVELALKFEPADCKPGQSVQCIATIKVAPTWHIYAMKGGAGPSQPTRLKLELPTWLQEQGDWTGPQAEVNLSNFGMEMIHSGELSFSRTLTIGSEAPAGAHYVACSVSLQACNSNRCLPPETFSLSLPIHVISP